MKKSKKFLLSLGSLAMLSIPLGTVLACGETVIVYNDKKPTTNAPKQDAPTMDNTNAQPTIDSSNPVVANNNVALPKYSIVSTPTYDYFQYEFNPAAKLISLHKDIDSYRGLKPETKMRFVTRIYTIKSGFVEGDLAKQVLQAKREFSSLKLRGSQQYADINAFPDELKIIFATNDTKNLDLSSIKTKIDSMNNEELVEEIYSNHKYNYAPSPTSGAHRNMSDTSILDAIEYQPFVSSMTFFYQFDFNKVLEKNGNDISKLSEIFIKNELYSWTHEVLTDNFYGEWLPHLVINATTIYQLMKMDPSRIQNFQPFTI